MRFTSLILVGSLASVLGTAACMKNSSTGDGDSADSAVDSSDSVTAEGNLMAANVDGVSTTSAAALTSDSLAAAITANINAKWPNACAVVTNSGSTITAVYNNCTGPRGLVHVTGTLDLTISLSLTGTVGIHATATSFEINNATLDISADATYSVSGTSHSLAVTTDGSGVGARGNDIDHKGSYTVSWDTASDCGTIAGHWQTDFSSSSGAAERSNDVNLTKCVAQCPSGTLTHHYLGGASLTLTFDGTADATWSTSLGGSGTVALTCN
jgi:hypothetical protein